ncbi:acyl-CoA dehydrogenase [Aeromicrobium sp. 50.2.37]|uniref:acyl-CoA dehydrogenase n=1 Tax=Aeromicrobium sp. 50.2.37 TaxID=2969305 RepID=UPI0021501D57|nr:acyl-CoA dehydrogenase [Aeromicrobium sp. 50.2.37]MCR4513625.1 acyl-CoA dehydrogenase [Aeromicrobium sp. 50.2.37]
MGLTADTVRERTRSPLPMPGSGATQGRLDALVALGHEDLSLAKLAEPHHDAVAIGADLGHPIDTDGVWAVWAAAPPFAVVRATRSGERWRLDGTKAFCSGADLVTHALVTADDDGRDRLFAVDLDQPGVAVDDRAPAWVGPGMTDARTVSLRLDAVEAVAVGAPGAYVQRPGFWHGAIGIAAVWTGGARAVADVLERSARLDEHGLAHRGAVRAALHTATALLDDAARRIDADPSRDAERLALSVRAGVADAVDTVLHHVGRATGPGPLAFDAEHARRVADLQVFVRQHHAERDLARLGGLP